MILETYDVQNPATYRSQGNRLVHSRVDAGQLWEERSYLYDKAGRVSYVVQKIAGDTEPDPQGGPPVQWYRGTQIHYNTPGQIAFARRVKWQVAMQGTPPAPTVVNEHELAAMEYRYDGARQRYLVRPRAPAPVPLGPEFGTGVWSEYMGDDIYGDYTVGGSATNPLVTETMSHVPGLGQYCGTGVPACASGEARYLHGNLIGTTERVTDAGGLLAGVAHQAVYTAFGELVSSSGDGGRYGFAGAWGYQSGDWDDSNGACDSGDSSQSCDPLAALGWLHVGARYYDPQSGRFVQRDPIGIRGGLNTYQYSSHNPASRVDPSGYIDWIGLAGSVKTIFDIKHAYEDGDEAVRVAVDALVDELIGVACPLIGAVTTCVDLVATGARATCELIDEGLQRQRNASPAPPFDFDDPRFDRLLDRHNRGLPGGINGGVFDDPGRYRKR